jgi:hypothetical protein
LEASSAASGHRAPAYVRDISRLTDDQLEALIKDELVKIDPALAVRYAAADGDERSSVMLKQIAGGEL